MGGEGSMAAMNSSLKNNRNLVKQRRNAFNKEETKIRTGSYNKTLRCKRVSKVKMEKIKRRLQQERKADTERMIKALLVTAMILAGIFLVVRRVYF